jgi:D-alanine-D-alanine ligase
MDYLVVNQTVYLNEVNSIPGSLSYYLLSDNITQFKSLLKSLIEESFKEFNKQNSFIKTFDSNILSGSFGKGGKGAKLGRR